MTDHPDPSPSLPEQEGYRLRLNNLLQSPGRQGQELKWAKPWSEGPDHKPTWNVTCQRLFHFSPCLLDPYLQSTVNGVNYGPCKGGTVSAAKEEAARLVFRHLLYEEAMPVIQRRLNPSP